MINTLYIICIILIGFYPSNLVESDIESHAEKIIHEIIRTKNEILDRLRKKEDQCIFLAFWDFDGTLIKGDCSEGLNENEKLVYKGLAQMAIENTYSKIYPPPEGVNRFFDDYRHMEENIGKWFAYPFIPQMLKECKVEDLEVLCRKHFDRKLKNFYFKSSIQILTALEYNGIENYIISASADIFVDAASETLQLPVERFNGIEVKIENGLITEKLVYPVTWAEGKTEKLISIVNKIKIQNPDKEVFVIAAFGNSYSTDGAFMKYVATLTLSYGKTTVVMINGGELPEDYENLFILVEQSETMNQE
jgi:phosphoserine phosphatase